MDRPALDRVEDDGIVARGRDLVRVAEAHPALLEPRPHHPRARHDDRLPALAHPDRGLVRALEAVDGRVGVVVGRDGDVVVARLGDPAGHGEGRGGGGDHAPRAVGRASAVPDETVKLMLAKGCSGKTRRQTCLHLVCDDAYTHRTPRSTSGRKRAKHPFGAILVPRAKQQHAVRRDAETNGSPEWSIS